MGPSDYVLVVEDDPDMAEVVALILEQAGYPSRKAENGQQALCEVAQQMPVLILLDMLMPVMDGAAFARTFRARYGGAVPIVVVTAAEHLKARSPEIEAEHVLPKPFEVDELLRIVERHLAGKQGRGARPDGQAARRDTG